MADAAGVAPDPETHRALFLQSFPEEAETFDRIVSEVRAGRAYIELSPSGESFAVLRPVRDLHVWTVGGKMSGVLDLETNISRHAAALGFDRMTTLPSRLGWDHALLERGWKPEPVIPLVKELL